MSDLVSINLRTTEDRANILTQLALDEDLSRTQLINHALDNYIEMRKQWDEGIKAGLKQVREGKVVPIEEVFKDLGVDLEN
jgi:predicted transcriptional regulator